MNRGPGGSGGGGGGGGGGSGSASGGGSGRRRERRWQTSQERARVAAELIEEAESLTQTGAIATPKEVARDQQPPPLRVAQPSGRKSGPTAKLDEEGAPAPTEPVPPPPPTVE